MSQIESQDVLIDSSALFKVFRENLSSQLINWIKKEKKRLIFSQLIISEMLGNKSEEKVINDFILLGKLLHELGNEYFAWIKIPVECLKIEILGKIDSIPLENDILIQKFMVFMSDTQQLKDAIKSLDPKEKLAAKKWKEENYLQLDLNVQNKILSKRNSDDPSLNPELFYTNIQNFAGPKVDSYFLEVQLEILNKNMGTKITTSQVIENPSRFRFLYTMICFAEVTALGTLLPRIDNSDFAVNLRSNKNDKGNWFDNNIATSASLCSLLLTEDKKFIWKCNYLYSKNLIQFRAKRISDILKF